MKKRILAFALTLAMVVGSLSMLSFVTFAVEPEPATDLYAWRATMHVDGSAGKDEPYVAANNVLVANNMGVAAAWDYDNVYLLVNYYEMPDGAKGLVDVAWTVGSATPESNSISKNENVYEASIPLNKLDVTVENGIISASMTLAVVYNDDGSANNETIEKNYNLIFSARSMISRLWCEEPVSTETNYWSKFDVMAYNRGTSNPNLVLKNGSATPIADAAGIEGGVAGSTKMVLWDNTDSVEVDDDTKKTAQSLSTDKIAMQATTVNMLEKISNNVGGANHFDMLINIGELRPTTLTKIPNSADQDTTATNFLKILSFNRYIGKGNGDGARLAIYSKNVTVGNKTEEHLFVAVALTGDTYDEYDLTANKGIKEGTDFRLGANENLDGTVDVLINEEIIDELEGKIVNNGWLTNGGGFAIALMRNGAVAPGSEGLKVTIDQLVVSKLNEVDVDTVSAEFKTVNGSAPIAAPATVINAAGVNISTGVKGDLSNKIAPADKVSIGSISKTWARWDTDYLYLYLDNQNIDKFNVNVGGLEASITYQRITDYSTKSAYDSKKADCQTLKAVCTSEDGITATVDANYGGAADTQPSDRRSWGLTLVKIPMSSLQFVKNGEDVCVDFSVEAIMTDQLTGGQESITSGSANGIVVLNASENATDSYMTMSNYSTILVGGGALSGSATLNLVGDKLTTQGRGIVTNYGSSYKVSGHTLDWSFNVDVTNLTEYSFDDIVAEGKVDAQEKWVENYGANEMDRLMYAIIYQRTAIDSTVSKAVSLFALINTDEGLVLTFSRKDGTVEKFKTGITHENGVKTSLPVNIVIHGDDSADIYVDGEKIGTLSDAKSDSANTSDAFMFVTNANYGCLYFAYRRETSAEKPMDVDISKATINIGVYEEQIEELTVATQVDSTGDIKLAYVQESEVAENKYDVRLIATINTLDAKVAGFKVALNSNEVTRETDTVYSSILANVNGDIKQINAADGEYFVALTITGVPATGTYTFEVTPYFTYANETTEGTTYEVTYTDGVFVSCVPAN